MSSKLFSPLTLRRLTLANRLVVSPMGQYNAKDGSFTDWHLMHLGQFAIGGFGLVMTEVNAVHPQGRITHHCAALWSDENEAALKRVYHFCREYGVCALGIQIGHAGRKASTASPFEGGKPLSLAEGGWQTVAPSAIAFAPGWPVPQQLSDLVAMARARCGIHVGLGTRLKRSVRKRPIQNVPCLAIPARARGCSRTVGLRSSSGTGHA